MKQAFLLGFFLFFLLGISYGQVKTYSAEWKKVTDLVNKSLPKSALTEVKKIYAKAKAEKQEAQVIKSLVFMLQLQDQTREDNIQKSIKELEAELTTAREPSASIMKSLIADLYWKYLQQNRWNLYNRTNTTNFVKEDIATWTLEDFHRKIGEYYLASIKNDKALKAASLATYEAIITKGNVRFLRPTLYDLVANKALDYFENDERDIKKPAYAFEISEPQAFAPAATFSVFSFRTRDTTSLKFRALQIYQDLIQFHLAAKRTDALIDVDIARIEYVYRHSTASNKDELYRSALENIIATYPSNAQATQASFLLASYWEQLANKYDASKDTAHRYARLKAKAILEKVVRDSFSYGAARKTAEGFTNSLNLLKEINYPSFEFHVEKVNLPAQPFRALVKYRNINQLHFRVIRKDKALETELQRQDDKFWDVIIKEKVIASWKQDLPETRDLQQHSVEIKIDALPAGEYFLIASTDGKFIKADAALGAHDFYVSSISYIARDNRFFVLHRETGQPLVKALVNVYANEYNYSDYKYKKVLIGTHQTDDRGFFTMVTTPKENRSQYFLDIEYKGERLAIDDDGYYSYYNPEDIRTKKREVAARIFFFTDRSIYRPGQTVHFKGIAVNTVDRENNIATNYSTTVYLRDANSQLVDSLKLTTNEFGSFNGKFQLPQNVLNGHFSITEKDWMNTIGFSVEEYKRPKFHVELVKPSQPFKAGDVITITGNAKAYAGNNIDKATVSYRVVRQPRFMYPWRMYRSWLPPTEPMEIAHGTTVTGNDGKFTISFTAIPDKSIDSSLDPVFDYRIYADVTDINGETRSAEKIVSAGYKSLLIQLTAPQRVPVDSMLKVFVRTLNMNGEPMPAEVTMKVSRLIPESRLIRERYWQQPDTFVMSREEFIRFFPNDEYKNESDPASWPKESSLYTQRAELKGEGELKGPSERLQPGWYEIEISTRDKDGKEVKDIRRIEVYDPNAKQLSSPQYLFAARDKSSYEPGETAKVKVGTSASNVYLIHEAEVIKGEKKTSFAQLTNETIDKNYKVDEDDRGGFGLVYFFVKNNRFFQHTDVVPVPWSNKEMDIEYSTFRDKTLPGSDEKWTVKIKGYKGELLAAEMLASMYDASLDQFRPHSWNKPNIWPSFMKNMSWSKGLNFSAVQSQLFFSDVYDYRSFEKRYDYLISLVYPDYRIYGSAGMTLESRAVGMDAAPRVMRAPAPSAQAANTRHKGDGNLNVEEMQDMAVSTDSTIAVRGPGEAPNAAIQIRKNFNETAFFFPDLRTDKDGNIEFSFTTPEALTTWKLQTLAHTKELAFGLNKKEIITQKELMVVPNPPRFMRQGDRMEFSVKVVNMSDKEMTGQAELQLVDAVTNVSVDGWLQNVFPNQYFTVAAGQTEVVKFPIEIPHQYTSGLTWRVIARSGNVSDGEESMMPVLTNKVLVTETLALPMRGTGNKNFTFDKLLKSGQSPTAVNHALTFEYTSNPAWYAIQALPYMMEYPYDCAEQNWNRYYANALATKIANSAPRIKSIFEKWTLDAKADTGKALLSNLQKNQELKSALLEETPWVLDAKNEEQQKKNLGILFDMVRMSKELQSSIEKLKQMQSPNGGFVWFKGGPDDRYITQYIVTGIGHLKKLGAYTQNQEDEIRSILRTAIPYLDKKIQEDYQRLIRNKANLKLQHISYIEVQYLYMRSFFPEVAVPQASQAAYNFYLKQAGEFWTKQNRYMQGMIALALHRKGNTAIATGILNSLKERAMVSEEMGMYWNEVRYGKSWFWFDAPIETQSLMIEAFSEIAKDTKTVDDLRTWLLKNKQTNNWRTTKATAEACYALLLQGTNWLTAEPVVQVKLGNMTTSSGDQKTEAGTGYFKKRIEGNFVRPEMGNVSVTVSSPEPVGATWGAVYWQYFEEMDKVTSAATPLQLTKKLFVEKNTDRGPVLSPVQEGSSLKVGDKIKVRIEIRVDRDMEYVHMKDLRASALEPVNVLSGYKWQGGLGYYETTRDASTNFFFSYLRKGTYVFEYPLFVTHTGNFTNGITTIQSMYAPEFSAHSEGVRITVE